jgi:VanZ family protein
LNRPANLLRRRPGVFFLLLLLAGYAGLTSLQVNVYVDDKFLHFVTFFLLTLVFYWIVDTNRRRTLNLTLVVCTVGLGVGSEFLQEFVTNNDRRFDIFDVVANVVGSLVAVGLCSFYHLRMLERKRQRKQYGAVPGEDPENEDLELGEGIGRQHEEGVTSGERAPTLVEEVDNWDENAEDAWEEHDGDVGTATGHAAAKGKGKDVEVNGDHGDTKQRSD